MAVHAFLLSLGATFAALGRVLVVVVGAAWLVRRGVVDDQDIGTLSKLSVLVFLPCLIFSNVVRNLDPSAMPGWWAIPLVAVAMPASALLLGAVFFFRGRSSKDRAMLALCSMQNAGFLVLPVGLALYPESFDRFALYCFLFILGFNPVLWSVGKMLSSGDGGAWTWRGLFTPPLVANLAAVLLVLGGGAPLVPDLVLESVELVGRAAVPVATVVLGAVLGGAARDLKPHLGAGLKVVAVKLFALPALTVAVLAALDVGSRDPLLARFLVVEASAAPAVGLILQVRAYGGEERAVGAVMLLCYAVCALSMPFWLALWSLLAG